MYSNTITVIVSTKLTSSNVNKEDGHANGHNDSEDSIGFKTVIYGNNRRGSRMNTNVNSSRINIIFHESRLGLVPFLGLRLLMVNQS